MSLLNSKRIPVTPLKLKLWFLFIVSLFICMMVSACLLFYPDVISVPLMTSQPNVIFQRDERITADCLATCGPFKISTYRELVFSAEKQAIATEAPLKCSLCVFNSRLSIAKEEVKKPKIRNINHNTYARSMAIGRVGDRYFSDVAKYRQVQTFLLQWMPFTQGSWLSPYALPIKQYYLSQFPPNTDCLKDPQACLDASNQIVEYIPHDALWNESKTSPGDVIAGYPDYPLFLHRVIDANIDDHGNVYTGWLDIVPLQCVYNLNRSPSLKKVYETELFIATQNAIGIHSDEYALVTSLARLLPYRSFLLKHKSIFVHVPSSYSYEWFTNLGIEKYRLVKGTAEASIVYLPQGIGCGWLNPIAMQLLQRYFQPVRPDQNEEDYTYEDDSYRDYSKDYYNDYDYENDEFFWPTAEYAQIRDRLNNSHIVVIGDTKWKVFPQHSALLASVSKLLPFVKLDTFPVSKHLNMNQTISLFKQGNIIVTPRGYHSPFMVICKPGTVIIELLGQDASDSKTWGMSVTLGHRYIGIRSVKPNELQFDVDKLARFIKTLLESPSIKRTKTTDESD